MKILHPEDFERVMATGERVRETGEPFEAEYRMIAKDGQEVWVRDEAVSEKDEEGRPCLWRGVMLDITERKRAEAALEESEERFRTTFEAANAGMAHAAPDGRWLRVNARFCEILGREHEEFLGTTFRDLTPPEELEASEERVRRILAGELGPYSVERRFVNKDGSRVWVNLAVSLTRGASGEPRYFVCVIEDITERKLAEFVPNPLTPMELEVLKLIARWQTNKDIAQSLAYSEGMIKHHIHNILVKLEVRYRHQAATKALEIGLISSQR